MIRRPPSSPLFPYTPLFRSKVPRPASAEWDTPIWHFGWNTANAVADYKRLAARGVTFFRVPPPSGHMVGPDGRSEEHTSELQSRLHLVCRLLLEKKKKSHKY